MLVAARSGRPLIGSMTPTMQPPSRDLDAGRVRVLYVAGTGRSGSTLVSNLLGSARGMVSLGELRYLWERGLDERSVCGCGRPVPECPFWQDVLARAYPDQAPDVAAVKRADAELLRLRSYRSLRRIARDGLHTNATATAYAAELTTVYRAISAATGGDVIIDSSNLPGYGLLLSRIEGIEVSVLHLVRDPRGVAYSWSRTRIREDRGTGDARMGREGVIKSSVLWDIWNRATENIWGGDPQRYVRVRYEDVVADPPVALDPVMRLYGMSGTSVPARHGEHVEMAVCHTVAGNPIRTIAGQVRLAADDEWRSALPVAKRAIVTAMTEPTLGRYGYPINAAPPASAAAATAAPAPARVFVEDMQGFARLSARIRRNVRWIRDEGLGRVLEEKEIDPLRNTAAAIGKRRYRRNSTIVPGSAVPVFVVGLQRSGTNMLMRGLGAAPETEVHNENDAVAFERFKLRPLPVVREIVTESRHSHVIFKPLCDSHRTDELLDTLGTSSKPLAVWVYRDMAGRVRSALSKFGDGNLQVLREFANGTNTSRWHVQRMSADTADFVRSFDYDQLSPASGAALMWVVRNQLYFDLGLDERPDTYLVSYNEFLAAPADTMHALCDFLGFPYRPALDKHVTPRTATYRDALDIDERIAARAADLAGRLDAATGRSAADSRR